MSYSDNAHFYISLIPRCLYNNSKANEQHLARFKQTPNVMQLNGPKQKYSFAKKSISDQEENVNSSYVGDVEDPLWVRHKGRQPKRYKSSSELSKKTIRNNKGERHCQKCKQTSHYAPRCPN
ncbi:12218_t:CDS:2 [Gigaspora margarita]|uniref:12218_t:CDS:1 n=1 Tax=Gigaspora margarita TaxID=4874 RepID=A0ABN7V4P8_GIGMA|nr:12218_t:CDS:2 [Gigaspora margarita]